MKMMEYKYDKKTKNMNKKELLKYIDSDNIIDDSIFTNGNIKKELLDDREIVIKICNKIISLKVESSSVDALKNLNDNFRDDEEIVELFLQIAPWYIEDASERIRGDKELIKNQFFKYLYGYPSLEYLSKEIQDDKEIVLMFVEDFHSNFRFASKRLQDDDEVFNAVNNDGSAYKYTSQRLRNSYKKNLLKDIKNNPSIYDNLRWHPLRDDKEILLFALECGYNNLNQDIIDEKFRKDKDVILLMIKNKFKSFYDWEIKSFDSANIEDWRIKSIISSLEYMVEDINIFCGYYCDDEILKFAQESYKKLIVDVAKLIEKDVKVLTKDIRIKYINNTFNFSIDDIIGKEILSKKEQKERVIGKRLNDRLKDGFDFYELIEFFEKELDLDLKPLIKKQLNDDYFKYRSRVEKTPISIDKYIEEEYIVEAYNNSELSSLTRRFKDYIENSDGYLNACDYCQKLVIDDSLDLFLRQERDMLVCKTCIGKEEVEKESGYTNYEFVSSIMENIGYGNFTYEDEECSIEDVVAGMNDLKKIIECGHSFEFARVLTMVGRVEEEVDYMLKYQSLVNEEKEKGNISDKDYEFFNKLLNTNNDEYDMPLSVDHEVLQYIKTMYY